mmetsp:Transcript_24448/g.53359  ORF Transcript_24448/g.53359 Transcript_24448/m.53359 type:complete len:236 (-) Transcript_24448:727-1434(-)
MVFLFGARQHLSGFLSLPEGLGVLLAPHELRPSGLVQHDVVCQRDAVDEGVGQREHRLLESGDHHRVAQHRPRLRRVRLRVRFARLEGCLAVHPLHLWHEDGGGVGVVKHARVLPRANQLARAAHVLELTQRHLAGVLPGDVRQEGGPLLKHVPCDEMCVVGGGQHQRVEGKLADGARLQRHIVQRHMGGKPNPRAVLVLVVTAEHLERVVLEFLLVNDTASQTRGARLQLSVHK